MLRVTPRSGRTAPEPMSLLPSPGTSMNRTLTLLLPLALLVVLAGCTEDAFVPSTDGPTVTAVAEVSPHALLNATGGRRRAEAVGSFSGPLFGLGTAPNGDVLVADAGVGVTDLHGTTEVPLPGVSDVSPIGRGSMWASTGAGADPTVDTGQGLYRVSKGTSRKIANLFAFEAANDPDGQGVDSNPFDVASLGGNAALVADAGANALLRVDNRGRVEVVAVFPDELVSTANVMSLVGCPNPDVPLCDLPPMIPAEAVPTSVVVGPDGYYYVGELKGFPAPTNESNVWRIAPSASGVLCGASPDCVKVFDGGFTSIIDLAFEDGTLYVAELDEESWFAVESGGVGGTINACDLSTGTCSEVATGIPILTAIAFDGAGALWATQNALIPGLATVVQVP